MNEKTYTLDETMTVIADDSGVHDIGGIMGGAHSGAADDTCDVLLEIAYFDPERIGVTGRKLGLASDARTRFERGVDPAFLDDGLALLTDLIVQTCGGQPTEVVRVGEPPAAFSKRSTSPSGPTGRSPVRYAAMISRARPTWSRKWSAFTVSITLPAPRYPAPKAWLRRPHRRSSSSNANCAALQRHADSTKR